MSVVVEYRGYKMTISVDEQSWGFLVGQWRGSFKFWKSGEPAFFGTLSRTQRSAYEAGRKAEAIACSVIDAEIAQSARYVDFHAQVLARYQAVSLPNP